MNNMVTKLSSIAAVSGVVTAIGASFIKLGKFQAKIDELDKRKSVINQTVDLSPIKNSISTLEVKLIDRIAIVEKKIPQDMTWVLEAHIAIRQNIAQIREEIAMLDIPEKTNLKPLNKTIKELENKIAELSKQTAIVSKENELQDILIEEIKTKANNPLAN